jgi:hypothetical protein
MSTTMFVNYIESMNDIHRFIVAIAAIIIDIVVVVHLPLD